MRGGGGGEGGGAEKEVPPHLPLLDQQAARRRQPHQAGNLAEVKLGVVLDRPKLAAVDADGEPLHRREVVRREHLRLDAGPAHGRRGPAGRDVVRVRGAAVKGLEAAVKHRVAPPRPSEGDAARDAVLAPPRVGLTRDARRGRRDLEAPARAVLRHGGLKAAARELDLARHLGLVLVDRERRPRPCATERAQASERAGGGAGAARGRRAGAALTDDAVKAREFANFSELVHRVGRVAVREAQLVIFGADARKQRRKRV